MYRRSFLALGGCGVLSLLVGSGSRAGGKPVATPEVATTCGRVRGLAFDALQIFAGVPYGEEVGRGRRFQAPTAIGAWKGVRMCTAPGPNAMQIDVWPPSPEPLDVYSAGGHRGLLQDEHWPQSENCLVLNVLTPKADSAARPVMVYIHGGAFVTGSGLIAVRASLLPKEHDVVLVSINHRLNVFGYLSLGGLDHRYADSGNAGMLDLILALKWVRDNIAQFGGNPQNITVFGESGGGWKISTLLAMPASRGLFHRACIESGSAIFAASATAATERAERLLHRLGIGRHSVDKLQDVPAATLLEAARASGSLDWAGSWPVIDGGNLAREPFDPDAPPSGRGVAIIVGNCADEDSTDSLPPGVGGNSSILVPLSRRLNNLSSAKTETLIEKYARAYPSESRAGLYLQITGDWDFGIQANRQAELKVQQGDPVYRYIFSYRPPMLKRKFGAFHAAELPLVMRLVVHSESEHLSRQMAAAWVSFARKGDPSQPELPWPRFSIEKRATMIFGRESHAVDDPRKEIRKAWEGIPLPRLPMDVSGDP